MNATLKDGGLSEYRPITHHEHNIFIQATKGLCGAGYTPLAVSTQVINGTMYRFLCDGVIIIPEMPHFLAIVNVAQLHTGEIKLENITKLVEEPKEE